MAKVAALLPVLLAFFCSLLHILQCIMSFLRALQRSQNCTIKV